MGHLGLMKQSICNCNERILKLSAMGIILLVARRSAIAGNLVIF
jgi:hypothetical protein